MLILIRQKSFCQALEKHILRWIFLNLLQDFIKMGLKLLEQMAVVGSLKRPTPIFDDYLEYIVLNPLDSTWESNKKRFNTKSKEVSKPIWDGKSKTLIKEVKRLNQTLKNSSL